MVTYFDNTMTGAPAMSGTAGAMLGVLDACLVTGFGLQAANTLVVAAGVATVALPGVHGLKVDAYVRIAGATPAGLNGDWPVTGATSQGFTFATTVGAGSATGSITASHAPLGWAKEFTGTNKAAYRSADVTGTRMRLRVDDTAAQSCRVVGYESMTDVDTGTNAFPTDVQQAGGLYWRKSSSADATARPWIIVGDSRSFYLYCANSSTYTDHGYGHSFGDYNSLKAGDPYACVLTGHTGVSDYYGSAISDFGKATRYEVVGAYLPRSYTGIGTAQLFYAHSGFNSTHSTQSGCENYCTNDITYPNGPDNGLITSKHCIFSNASLRGFYPGLYHTPQPCQSAFDSAAIINGSGAHTGRKLMALRTGADLNLPKNNLNTGAGVIFIDITGPWR